MSCLFYLIVVAIGSMHRGACMNVKFAGLVKCPNGCHCDNDNYHDDKYNIDCQGFSNCVNLTDLNSDCVKHSIFNISVSRKNFVPILSACGLNASCSMHLYLYTSSHEGFHFNIKRFKILCPYQLTGLHVRGPFIRTASNRKKETPFEENTGNSGVDKTPHLARSEPMLTDLPIHKWKMEHLESSGNDFSCITDGTLMNLHKLRNLTLSSNDIKCIGNGIFANAVLKNLTTIDLHNNKLKQITSYLFRNLSSIHLIDLSYNYINNISKFAFCSQTLSTLSAINLKNNNINLVPSKLFCNLSNLEYLNFANNEIMEINPDTFDNISQTNMKEILFYNNRIASIPNTTFDKSHLQKLTLISLSGNRIEDVRDIHIASFCQLPSISEINLSHNQIKIINITSFSNNNQVLVDYRMKQNFGFKVNLDYNQIHVIHIGAFNSPVLAYLAELSFEYNGLQSTIDEDSSTWSHPGYFPMSITLANNKLETIPLGFLRHFPSLKLFDLRKNAISEITENIFNSIYCSNLTKLDFSNNLINFVHRNAFKCLYLSKLQHINLKGNKITAIGAETFNSPYLNSLSYIDISENKLTNLSPLMYMNYQQRNMRLVLKDNLLGSVDISAFGVSRNTFNDACEETGTGETANDSIADSKGCTIDIRGNNISQITNHHYKHMNISIPKCHVLFDQKYFMDPLPLLHYLPTEGSKLTCRDTSLISYISTKLRPKFWCSCDVYNYVKLVDYLQPKVTNIVPSIHKETVCYTKDSSPVSGSFFLGSTSNDGGINLRCKVTSCTNSDKCICEHDLKSRITFINCSNEQFSSFPRIITKSNHLHISLKGNNIEHIPRQSALTRLNHIDLSYNKIKNITNAVQLLTTVTYLDLSHNSISNPLALNETLSLPNLETVYLSGNPFICNCEGKDVKNLLIAQGNVHTDFNLIECWGPNDLVGKSILKLPDTSFDCTDKPEPEGTLGRLESSPQTQHNSYMSTLVASVVLTVIAVALFTIIIYKYRKYFKVILYSRFGWRFGYKYNDEKKQYDIFISYSSLDSDWVLDTLLSHLENNQPPFRVNVHQRDFLPGNSILNNIAKAITNTKSVILVMSNNFIDSEWCKFEFREAVSEAIKKKYPQIIVVLLEPIEVSAVVGEELHLYLRTHTYIEWGSSHFWPRLMMSLPEPRGHNKQILPAKSPAKVTCQFYRKTVE